MTHLRKIAGFATMVGLLAGTLLSQSCGSDSDEDTPKKNQDSGSDTSQGGTAGQGTGGSSGSGSCELAGATCAANSDCCSANCDPVLNACTEPVGACKTAGDSCANATECCTLVCDAGSCGSNLCTSDNQPCTSDAQCCGGVCSGTCTPLSGSCKTSGNSCANDSECCSHSCANGNCAAKPSFCTQTGDICGKDTDCCAGICTKQSGATVGLCTPPSAPGTTGCLVAGEVCGAGASGDGGTVFDDAGVPACGGECCSRACAPYGPTGVFVCQPPSGCRPTGEVCVDDSDCCGSAGLPGGNGSVTCSKDAGEPVGRCDNGNACRPAGAVCKLATSSCNAENNCCAGNVNQDPTVCQQDLLGIPRCTGVGDCADAGSLQGQACATSADCCGLPCLPGTTSDGGTSYTCGGGCVQSGSTCTTDADCCSGLPCNSPPGSTKGTCGTLIIPDAGTDGGGGCALYGQECSVSSDCCNGVPCTNGHCVFQIQ